MDFKSIRTKEDLINYCDVKANINPTDLFPEASPLPNEVEAIKQSEDGIITLVKLKLNNPTSFSVVEYLIFVGDSCIGYTYDNCDYVNIIDYQFMRVNNKCCDYYVKQLSYYFHPARLELFLLWLEGNYLKRGNDICLIKKIVW